MRELSFWKRKLDAFAIVLLESSGSFFVSIALSKFLVPADRGNYSTVVATIFLISFLGSNVHNRAVYFRAHIQDRTYTRQLFASLLISTLSFTILGTFICTIFEDFAYVTLLFIFFGSVGVSIFNFIVAYLSSLNNHSRLQKFSLLVFICNLFTVVSVYYLRSPTSAILFWIASIWMPVIIVVSRNRAVHKNEIFPIIKPNKRFIRKNLYPRLTALPMYISIFDSLKIDVLFCTLILGYEYTGNYVLATTFCVSLQFLYRLIFLSSPKTFQTQNRISLNEKFWKSLTFFVVMGALAGVLLGFYLPRFITLVFPLGYQISRIDFLFIWAGNLLFWGRRLIGDFMINQNFDKWIGISEFIGAVLFVSLLVVVNPESLRNFSIVYSFSLAVAFFFLLTMARRVRFPHSY